MKICRTTFLLMSLLCTFPVLAENRLYEESELSMTQIDTGNPEQLDVQPKEFTLAGSRQQLQLVVTGFYADGQIADLTRAAQFQVATPTLAVRVESGHDKL